MDEPTPKQIQAIYNETYFAPSKYADRATMQAESDRRLNLLRRFVPPGSGKRVLDAGCATGDFIEAARNEYEMHGVELSSHAVQAAREKNPGLADRISVGSLEAGELPDLQLDAICLWDVIEHMWNPVAVCGKLLERLRPGGYLLFSTPAADATVARVLGKYWAFMTPPEHLSFFSKKTTQYLFECVLSARVRSCERMGKRANVGFIFYKLRRILPFLVPQALVSFFRRPSLAHWAVYVPTGDVQYAVIEKPVSPAPARGNPPRDDTASMAPETN